MNKNKYQAIKAVIIVLLLFCFIGCGNAYSEQENEDNSIENEESSNESTAEDINAINSSEEADVDNTDKTQLLNEYIYQNEDVIALLSVEGTDIEGPVLQSWEEDDYYASHNDQKQLDSNGAMYIEMANMANMCDFNTVIHGSGGEDGIFGELIYFENPDFFEKHEEFVVYLPDNKLTYEIWAVFERDNTSLIREYDFTYQSGCRQFLDDVYGDKVMGKQIRGGWGDANENMFMVTLTVDNPDSDKQLVVIGALVDDEAGTIDRIVSE